jgi:glycosyltransferase involved in cell wall biosynthesis
MIYVCLCTHNPRLEILTKVLASIKNQSVVAESFHFLIVDNASNPPLDDSLLDQIIKCGISARIIREPSLGLQYARIAAVRNTCFDWILWVDDDNELSPDFIKNGLDFIRMHPEVGCFGGKLLLPKTINPSKGVIPFLPYLGIKDNGNTILIEKTNTWTLAEPPGAGAWVHRKVLDAYLKRAEENAAFFQLGRSGSQGLASCDDSIMMREAFNQNLACAYVPSLWLYHHLDNKRFKFNYLIRLMFGYGESHTVLARLLNGPKKIPKEYLVIGRFLWLLLKAFKGGVNQSFAFGIGIVAYHLGVRSEYLRQQQKNMIYE